MLKQIKYFHMVVQEKSFSKAAEKCFISQSAISQQIKTLENELGVLLLKRENRTFTLTPAGEYFYRKSLLFLADFERLCQETRKLEKGEEFILHFGYNSSFGGLEFHKAVAEFSTQFPDIPIEIIKGTHEELFQLLKSNKLDLILSDQRRAFSDEYINNILIESPTFIEIASYNPIAKLKSISTNDLRNIPCILISSKDQQTNEASYYSDILGIESSFLFAQNLEEARFMILSGKGYLPIEGGIIPLEFNSFLIRIPLYQNDNPVKRNYCSFYKRVNSGNYIDKFSSILKSQFN